MSTIGEVIVKECECGCGNPAPISPVTDRTQGYVKGQPRRFLQGHHNKLIRKFPKDGVWTCAKCGEVKPVSEFHRASNNARGFRGRCKVCEIARTQAWRDADPERARLSIERSKIKKKYGLTLEEFHARKKACEVCGSTKNPKGKGVGLVIDHNHTTGELRGVLCSFCNRAIGQLGDDPERIRRAAEYLESYS